MSRYTDDWNEIALAIKEKAGWRCSKCGMQCIRPGEDTGGLTKSERAVWWEIGSQRSLKIFVNAAMYSH